MTLAALRHQIRQLTHQDEHQAVEYLLAIASTDEVSREQILSQSRDLVSQCRSDKSGKGTMDAFLQEFGLSNKEGVALMCLAEALLRVPDGITADRLIAEKISQGNWSCHRGKSDSLFVNASTWGLMLTGKIVALDTEITQQTDSWVTQLVSKVSEPVVRRAVLQAMRIMGGQYVLGRTIDEGMQRGVKENPARTRFSFDMLGEGARTEADAENYYQAYYQAISRIGKNNAKTTVVGANGISVKLSALYCRYHYSHQNGVMSVLLPRIKALCLCAKEYGLGLSIDAEESERLDMSLDIFASLAEDKELADWEGLGFVLQAYQKRAPAVADWLIALGQESGRRLMVRLVKGAYWDAEIKHAQEQGFKDYPVFTRKANTDLCYQVCAEKLLAATEAIYPQFATHNAYTVCLVLAIAKGKDFEFQRLHGMGELLYKHLELTAKPAPLRVYAPIGQHQDLLPYLVRRLLENGANSSFVNRFLDRQTPVEALLDDVYTQVLQYRPYRHPNIPLPPGIYRAAGDKRDNAKGIDLDNPIAVERLLTVINTDNSDRQASAIVGGEQCGGVFEEVVSPADRHRVVGHIAEAQDKDVQRALLLAHTAQPDWQGLSGEFRAVILERMGDILEQHTEELMAIIVAEAGRTIADALSEVREAVDFCRYYAQSARYYFSGHSNSLTACGTFLCISPWNFPLAIFTGQIAAALAAGNSVLAKPAEQTPLVAARAVALFHSVGVPVDNLHLLPGDGARIGATLLSDPRLSGVAFTGSTETAQIISRQLALREGNPVPLIAETGGQNAMIVDSTALPEQVVDDVIASAFLSAGQRCSALRVLYIQEDIADKVLSMLAGAMDALSLGDPAKLSTDIGPVIDKEALQGLQSHIKHLHKTARFIATVTVEGEQALAGYFFAPHVFEIQSLNELPREVFGPVLHVVRYRACDLKQVLDEINQSGYGLTLGVHSRIEAVAEYIYRQTRVGNTYINRNTVGAVVGVNPFGGHGLSGTGPKAGGPYYLLRFANTVPDDKGGAVDEDAVQVCQKLIALSEQYLQHSELLPGPTGEENRLTLYGRGRIVCVVRDAYTDANIAQLLALPLLAGCSVQVAAEPASRAKVTRIIKHVKNTVLDFISLSELEDCLVSAEIAGVSLLYDDPDLALVKQRLAARQGALLPLVVLPSHTQWINNKYQSLALLMRFVIEKTRTENLVARGGNTQLFNLTE
ncbi:bifunctional proline dehydrogenase/L-glutamate gamma-semialdehyde dehydrogenase PutA [Oceanicoccus sagamiensis]|uniref:Bifunctional protein PutA n=1 Tax=Oceanicoccus sagamiensis TaxID=716816 RepID=A0A1X9NDK9_9GAMM|nr:bifunctional proline dehydrogenase/L-glutamate gamma-semialdehyde dehydrogenase PutA [Oceanicoccus sagamiensis]ARN75241.1 bifunctional proline dehydrogenase/L-glutamate gamma-semialdehyde dehydrogenase [Oceanicoccus sagamiensis]